MVNFALADRQRQLYKTAYESFKMQMTTVHLVLYLLQLLVLPRLQWLDAAANFLTLYFYSTIVLREHILVINGSNIRNWWIWHHYLCVAIAGTILIWPNGPTYLKIRSLLLVFSIYIAAVQLLQYRYQMNRLYTLRALAKIGPMETITESAQVHIRNNLAFLLPFLLIGHIFQFYISYVFGGIALESKFMEWQVAALSVLFAMVAFGNIVTTLYTYYRKVSAPRSRR